MQWSVHVKVPSLFQAPVLFLDDKYLTNILTSKETVGSQMALFTNASLLKNVVM